MPVSRLLDCLLRVRFSICFCFFRTLFNSVPISPAFTASITLSDGRNVDLDSNVKFTSEPLMSNAVGYC